MGEVSAEPSMEDILSSIKRIIAEEGDGTAPPRARRSPVRAVPPAIVDPAPVSATQSDDDEILELSDPMPADPPRPSVTRPVAVVKPAMPVPESIASDVTAHATRGALDMLSRLMVKPEPPSDGTLEGLVREMLKPMLRDWIDANLPAMVETMVAREIGRITGEGR